MIRLNFLIFFLLFATFSFAQTKPKQTKKMPSQKEMEAMMKEVNQMIEGLSTEEKKIMDESMKQVKQMQESGKLPVASSYEALKIPAKQTAMLAKIPQINTTAQFKIYLSGLLQQCKTKIDKQIITGVDGIFSKAGNGLYEHAGLSLQLLLEKKPLAAMYAAVKAANNYTDNNLVQNNLSVVLHQTGYGAFAIPLLQFLSKTNNDPIIKNNLGQSYLSLGDTAQARKYFAACLAANPNDLNALCGSALILSEGGKKQEANQHIIKALKKGYSKIAEDLAKKNGLKLKFSDVKQTVPEYFNPQKYKPTPSATNKEQVKPVNLLRIQLHEMKEVWERRFAEVHTEVHDKTEKQKMADLTKKAMIYAVGGNMTNKARMMFDLCLSDFMEHYLRTNKERAAIIQNNKSLHDLLTKNLEAMSRNNSFGSKEAECEAKTDLLNKYLEHTSFTRDAFIRKDVPHLYDFTNQTIFWAAFFMSKEEYQLYFTTTVRDFFERLSDYDKLHPPYTSPSFIVENICNIPPPKKPEKLEEVVEEEMECWFSVEIPLGNAKAVIDCESIAIEGGEGLQGGFEKNFRTGELTVFGALGYTLYGKGGKMGGIEAGGRFGSFIKVNGNFNVIDCGDFAEGGIEGGIGPLQTEAKLTAVMGMESGINVEKNIFGTKEVIFTY